MEKRPWSPLYSPGIRRTLNRLPDLRKKGCAEHIFLALLTLWAYVRYTEELKSQNSNSKRFYLAALVLFALALMSKPMVVTLPFLLLLLDWWPLCRLASPGAFRRLVVEKIPFIVMSAICCVLTVIAQRRGGEIISLQLDPLKLRIYYALLSYVRYIGKLFAPVNLAAIYPQGPLPVLFQVMAAGCVLGAVSVVAFMSRHKRPYWIVGWYWFLGSLVPVIGLVQVGGQTIADRYTYVPFLGLFIIICWQSYDYARNLPQSRMALGSVATLTLAACAWTTSNQLQSWRNSGTLFLHAATVTSANYAALGNYAEYLANIGEAEQARIECENALQIYPDYALANTVLGAVLDSEGNYDEAARHLKIALQSNPRSLTVQQLLGGTLLLENQPIEAARIFYEELKTDPASPAAHCGLAKALAAQNETTNAISHYRLALQFTPDYPEALNNLAWILASDPRADIRNGPEAIKLAARACDLTRYQQPQEIGTLAAAEAESGQFDDAATNAQKARDLALAQGQKDFAARCLEMKDLYRSHRPYHQPP